MTISVAENTDYDGLLREIFPRRAATTLRGWGRSYLAKLVFICVFKALFLILRFITEKTGALSNVPLAVVGDI